MRWLLKAMVQKSISILPNPERVNYLLQSKVTKAFPRAKQQFLWRVSHGVTHYKAIRKYDPEIASRHGYEFGAGWDLIIPLTYYCLGIETQTVVDIRPNLRFELVNDTLRRLNEYRSEIEDTHGVKLREVDPKPVSASDQLSERFGINYLAPCDATATGLPADLFDFITNTYTLEHVPRTDIILILRECHRLLKPSGVISALIDMQDHYALSDRRISVYNYLQFPAWAWNLVNSSLHHQNRLRYSDYVGIIEELGFRGLEEWIDQPTEDDLATLRSLRLDPAFTRYTEASLAAKRLGLVMEKPPDKGAALQ